MESTQRVEGKKKEGREKRKKEGGRNEVSKRKQTGAEIYEVENKHITERINEVRSWFFEKSNIDKPLAIFYQEKEREATFKWS